MGLERKTRLRVWTKWASVPVWAWSLWAGGTLEGTGKFVPGSLGTLCGIWCYWQGNNATGTFPLFPGAMPTYGTFCTLWIES